MVESKRTVNNRVPQYVLTKKKHKGFRSDSKRFRSENLIDENYRSIVHSIAKTSDLWSYGAKVRIGKLELRKI